MPIKSNALPLNLSRPLDEQPDADTLAFALNQKLNELPSFAAVKVTANALPLPLTRPLSDQPPASTLPFNLNRPLGTIGAGGDSDTPVEPPKPPRRMAGVMSWVNCTIDQSGNIGDVLDVVSNSQYIGKAYQASNTPVNTVTSCQYLSILGFISLSQAHNVLLSDVVPLQHCAYISVQGFVNLRHCHRLATSDVVSYRQCAKSYSAKVVSYKHCQYLPLQPVISYSSSVSYAKASAQVAKQQASKVKKAVPVPCRYYPIPEPPPVKPSFSCRPRPPSNALPLALTRKRKQIPSSALPLPLMCWHDDLPPVIPSLRSYIVHNIISATVGGIDVDPLDFNIKTDMSGSYWQGSIEISETDYQRIKSKLNVERGNEPLINITINDFLFTIICEELSRSRQFINNTYSLSGRSITAKLGADYATTQGGLIEQDSYASQIARQQLANLPYQIADWDIPDWLVPAGQYAVTSKTPIAVIADIAKVAGGFLISHPSKPLLSLKPKWRVPAWDIATATPDIIVPADVIQKIDDTPRVNPRYNTVTLTGNTEGGIVYRNQQARDSDAPTQHHALYTDRDVIIPAGQAALSESGTHGDYTIKLPWTSDYDLPLAELGRIWQIGDPEGAWRGVVTGVSVSIDKDNDAPCVYQTVSIDRYQDN